ncbi:hypothetical protein FOA52_003589 [Chlamydomonas sp. UWO 241]|nr:hypothetical protein FOA52_003589 [Chlamydomonas sp. UWO 241]
MRANQPLASREAPGSFDGVAAGDAPQVQGRRAHKRSAAAAAAANGADTDDYVPPAKKSRSQTYGQLSSGAAKATQKHKAPNAQPPAKAKSSFRGVFAPRRITHGWEAQRDLIAFRGPSHHYDTYQLHDICVHAVYDRTARRAAYLGKFGSEEAARAHDRASIVCNGTEAKTNFPVSD